MRPRLSAFAFSAAVIAAASQAGPMRWPDLLGRAQPKPDTIIAYGTDPLQHVELWLPKAAGRHPVVLMIHGGCWQTGIAKADIMNWIADDLRQRGIAVWNVEYRGIDRPGGGYPGTFRDVAQATDALAVHADRYRLRTDRIVVVGHSAGGHLALWLAARGGIAPDSPLFTPHPTRIAAAISLGGLPDLEAASRPPGNTCDNDPVPGLVGPATAQHQDVFADTSPARLAAPALPVLQVNGTLDRIAPPASAEAYAARRPAHNLVIPGEGHVELIAPDSKSWQETVALIHAALR